MSNFCKDVFEYIKRAESEFNRPIRINDNWDWSFKTHTKTTENYAHSQLAESTKTTWTPVKNIIRPILNMQHRTEDVEVKDVSIYINNPDRYHLSLLVKKYHDDVFVVENDMDTFFDELNVSRIDFGGGLSKKLFKPRPEVVPLQSIAFCNQRDMISSPLGILHEYSPDQLLEMRDKGWGDEANGATSSIEALIRLWRDEEVQSEGIKIYEVHGNLPKSFANPEYSDLEYAYQIFIVGFYQPNGKTKREGVILYTAEEENPFKLVKRDPVYGRCLGFGGAEELFEAQVWTNYDAIRKQNMLDAAAVTIMKTTDPTVTAKHPKGLKGMKNLEIIDIASGSDLSQVDTVPRSIRLFENSMIEWENHAKDMGAAQDPVMGKEPAAGTPFSSLIEQVRQGMGLHEYRRGQYAKHLEEIYNDWIIPHIKKEITKGFKFLTELSVDEMQFVADRLAVNKWNEYAKEKILSGQDFIEGEQEMFIEKVKEDFKKSGNKQFLEALKDEFKDTPLSVKVSIAGKSKALGQMTDKLVNIWRFVIANPQGFAQIMQMPGMAKSWNEIMQYSGMSPVDFSNIGQIIQPQALPSPVKPEALELNEKPA